jgi:predicted membrane-bound spermidine synthase
MHPPSTRWLFLVSFIEGGALMAAEIAGAKLVAPFYGNSLYVWAAVLGLTLGGLATGYFLGAVLSRHWPRLAVLHGVIALAALLVALMPWSAAAVMNATLHFELRLGITVSCLVFLFPPLLCFGTVSPLIIRLANSDDGRVGHVAGKVYAISTLGGILATALVAFHTIPEIGLRETLLGTALLLALIPLCYGAWTLAGARRVQAQPS